MVRGRLRKMYLEIKSLLTVVAIIFISIVLSQLPLLSIFAWLLIAAIFLIIFSDVLIGYRIVISDARPIIEPTPAGKELMELQLLDGTVRFINTVKGPYGQRKFRIHDQDASVINTGKGMGRLPNGNVFFRAHESYDQSIDPFKCKYLEGFEEKDIKEIYEKYARKGEK